MNRIIASIFILCALISCNNRKEEKNAIIPEQEKMDKDSAIVELYQQHLKFKISEPIQIQNIENLKFTSSVISTTKKNEFCDSLKAGFFGTYNLLDENFSDERGRPVGGTITVHVNSDKGSWNADDTTQTIWKIHLSSDVLSVWDSIHVGLTREEIVLFGKENNGFCVKKGNFYYSCDFNNFSVVYIFKSDTLKELTVTRKCEIK